MGERAKRNKVGIMGGTFDPIHYGHLVTAEAARTSFNLDNVVFVPTGKPPHKKDYEVSPSENRYLMTVLATVTNTFFEVSRIEIDKKTMSYTTETLEELNQIYDNDTELYFISGADAILEILTWKQVDKLLSLCEFIAATRPGYEMSDLHRKLKFIKEKYNKEIYSIEVPAMAISSTNIRKRVKNGNSIKYLVPESVEYYIKKNILYK